MPQSQINHLTFVSACRSLENKKSSPRSFQILIPRLLPALFEIRNNRGVGHVGGDVDPNHMDSTAVLSMASWVMAEIVRVFHNVDLSDAQTLVDSLVERRIPLVWQSGNIKRVLDPSMGLKDQILLLISSAPSKVKVEDLKSGQNTKIILALILLFELCIENDILSLVMMSQSSKFYHLGQYTLKARLRILWTNPAKNRLRFERRKDVDKKVGMHYVYFVSP